MIVRAAQVVIASAAIALGAAFAFWFADTDAPSVVTPLDRHVTVLKSGAMSITYCVRVERLRSCNFTIEREILVGAERRRMGTEYRPAQPAPKVIERTCVERPIPVTEGEARQYALTLKVRASYSCNPLRAIWPISREIAFEPLEIK